MFIVIHDIESDMKVTGKQLSSCHRSERKPLRNGVNEIPEDYEL